MPAQSATSNRAYGADRKIRAKKRPAPPKRTYRASAPAKQPGPISDNEYKRVEQHKRTRSYYNAHRKAYEHRPTVQRARAELKRGTQMKRRGDDDGEKVVLRSLAALDELRRHGPDTVAETSYRWYLGKLWDKARQYYPDPGVKPEVKVDYRKDPPGYAWVMKGENVVHYSPFAIREYMESRKYPNGLPNPHRARAETVPLHEWAHTRQSRRTFDMGDPATEGGAEAVEEDLSRTLGLTYFEDQNQDYNKWAAEMRRRFGPAWIHYLQYR